MESVFLLCLMWWFIPVNVSSDILRNKCKREADFRQPYTDYSLYGHVISNITVPDVICCTFECLNTQQCLSYNYKDEGINNCELNDATMEMTSRDFHKRPGYKYYDTQKAPSKCASSPCLNGGKCVETCSIDSQITCECKFGTYGDKCQSLKDNKFNYDIIFPSKNGTTFAAVSMGTTIVSFTLCMWLQTTDPGPFHLFSYVTRNHLDTKELSLECETNEDCKLLLLKENREVSLISLNDGKWRHVCLTWSSAAGAWNVYLDGALRGSGSGLGTGLSLHGSGRLVLGQDQVNTKTQLLRRGRLGQANAAKSFVGNITQFNLWDQVIEQPTIKNISRYCGKNQTIGNITCWSEFRMKITGQARIGLQSSCNATSEESRFVLDFPSVSANNVVVRNLSIPSISAGTICWWMKTGHDTFNVFSYVAPGELNPALEIHFGSSWRFHLILTSTKLAYESPYIGDSYWHHFCTDWNSSTTVWHIYLDGVLQFTEMKKDIQDYTVQGGGIFHLGQYVQNGAYDSNKPFQGMLTGFNIWTKTLSARAVAALAREPGTESGDALAWSMLREGIMGNVEISYINDVELTAKESDYTLNFTKKSNNSYAIASYKNVEELKTISACAWIKTTAKSGELTIFSYSNDVHVTAIVLSIIDGNTIQMNINTWDIRITISVDSNLTDGSWHHICISWRSVRGEYRIYFDQQIRQGDRYKTNEKVDGGGRFILGQRQNSLGQNDFDTSKAFVGEITRVNVWMKKLELPYAENMGRGCGLWNGNMVRWSELKSSLVGDVEVIPGSECFVPDITVQERRNAVCQNSVSFESLCQGLNSFSLFDFANLHGYESGRRLRCYNEDALTSSDFHYRKKFDKVKGSTCAKNMPQELMNITR